ncbi:MAG: calcium-binding protein [Pseudomonadota bacterium]
MSGVGELEILLRITPEFGGRASGRSPEAVAVGRLPDGRTLAEAGAAYELRTGSDPNGATCDIELTLDPEYLRKFIWIDPDPATRSVKVPTDKFDAVSLFLHELGHGFGFNGYGDEAGHVAGGFLTTYDAQVQFQSGYPVFTGAEAAKVYGRAVPLSPGDINNYTHYGRVEADGLNLGVMEGATYSPAGFRWYLDKLDLAFLRDLGLNAVENPSADPGGSRFQGFASDDVLSGGIGADTLSGGGGSNYLRGAEGDDSIVGGAGFDDINGNMGNDTCVSGGGDDWVVGGRDNDSLQGSEGANLVYGNLGADTCEGGAGNDIVRGGQENDVVRGGAGADYVSGDKGDDTVSGGAGADQFHSFGDAGLDRVLDFSLAEGDRVRLDPGTTYTVAQSGADTVVSMNGGGQVVLVGVSMSSLTGDWIFVG